MKKPLRVGLLGLGTVGCGVARILLEQRELIARRAGREVHLVRAACRDLSRTRTVSLPPERLTDDAQIIIDDPAVDLIVQVIGGIDPASTLLRNALENGKDVVTANKALLSEQGPEIFRLARARNCSIGFEAAVAGGIPVISAIGQALSANQIVAVEAILNGTSNFILTEMLGRNHSFREVLDEAQQLGYAEADPSMDIDGTDAAQKLAILVQLAFGTRVNLNEFVIKGIDTLDLVDLKYAWELGYKVKLLAVSRLRNEQLELHVQPTLVHRDRPLAQTDGPCNMLAIEGDAVGKTWFSGPGAGQMATASAVVSDIIDAATGRSRLSFPLLDLWQTEAPRILVPREEAIHRYYLRFQVADRPHVFADIADILGRNEISLASIIQHEAPESDQEGAESSIPLVVMTHRTSEGQILQAEQELVQLDSLTAAWIRMPVAN